MVGSHFNDGDLSVFWNGEQGEGHPDMVVEVALGECRFVPCLQNRGSQLFGCRFAVGARDPDEGNVKLLPVMNCQFLQGGQGVVHHNTAVVAGQISPLGDCVGCSLFQGVECELVAVKIFSFQTKEKRVWRNVARVCADAGVRKVDLIQFFNHGWWLMVGRTGSARWKIGDALFEGSFFPDQVDHGSVQIFENAFVFFFVQFVQAGENDADVMAALRKQDLHF